MRIDSSRMDSTLAMPAGMPSCTALTYTLREKVRCSVLLFCAAFCSLMDAVDDQELLVNHELLPEEEEVEEESLEMLVLDTVVLEILALKLIVHSSTCTVNDDQDQAAIEHTAGAMQVVSE